MTDSARFAVVVVDRVDEYQTRLLRGIHAIPRGDDLRLLVHATDPFVPGVPPTLKRLLNRGAVAGMIITSLKSALTQAALDELLGELDLPSVGIGVGVPDGCRVHGDNERGMSALMGHLLDECGVRTPVLVRGLPHQNDSRQRESIFREQLARRGLAVDEELVIEGEFNQDVTYRAMRELLTRRKEMDAVVALNDLSAIGAMLALGDVGLRVPEDVLVTGFDNEQAAARTWPGLTTVDPQLEEQGHLAMRHLLASIAGERRPGPVVVPARPVLRRSTARKPDLDLDDARAALEMARAANTEVAALDAIIELNRAMMTCTGLQQVVTELTARLDRLGLGRCFVVMFGSEDGARLLTPAEEDPESRRDHARLVLAHAFGAPRPFAPGPFPTGQVLPEPLQDEFATGTLVIQPLSVPEGDLGYALFEQERDLVNSSEVLRMDLSRTLHAVATAKELADHAATLERQVTQRTKQLSAEVAVRQRAESELQRMNDELQRSLMLDGLTRIANRAAFQRHLEQHWALLAGTGEELALLMVDVDLFKAYNDQYGHLVGDDALRTVAQCLERAVRDPEDLACRYGGEEFAVVLPRTGTSGAGAVAERFRAFLALEAIPHEASSIGRVVTASVGIAAVRVSAEGGPVHLVDAADRALYRAKRAGRNRIAIAGPIREAVGRDAPSSDPAGRQSAGPDSAGTACDPPTLPLTAGR